MTTYGIRKYSSSGRKRTKEEIKASYYQNWVVKCKCGHTFLMTSKEPKKLCTQCGEYYYKDKKLEFREKLNRELRRIENE